MHEVNELPGVCPHTHEQAPPYMQELLRYVVEHVDEKMTAESLAAKFYISSAKLNRDFLASTRITLHKYITAVRVSRAKIWLSEDIPLSIIAQKTGVSQESAFVYMFRRETGMTPIAWKRRFCGDAKGERTV